MRILVTGKNGQVGWELQTLAKASRHEWLCCDRSNLDISNQADVDRVVDAFAPDVVINAAAYTAVDKAESDQDVACAINAHGPAYLAQACQRNGAALLHISTDYVFAGDSAQPYVESDDVGPTGVYGASKLAGEIAIAEQCPRHIILRTAWVFGSHGNNFVKTMLRVAQTRDTLGVVADQHGAPTSAEGIATALLNITEHIDNGDIEWGTYHYSGEPFTTWHGFAETIFAGATERGILPHTVTVNAINTSGYPTPAQRPGNSRLDCSKIEKQFRIKPDDWKAQLEKVLDTIR
jgi:dTDP-4-dehydrorhamnose reductase